MAMLNKNMFVLFNHLFILCGLCAFAHIQSKVIQSEHVNFATETRTRRESGTESGSAQNRSDTQARTENDRKFSISDTEPVSAWEESSYFVSELFKKYGNSSQLSPDGFARLLCNLGLVPLLTETIKNENKTKADDTNRVQNQHLRSSLDCSKLTFKEVEIIFENRAKTTSDQIHETEEESEDHDYQASRNDNLVKSSAAELLQNDHHDQADETQTVDHGDQLSSDSQSDSHSSRGNATGLLRKRKSAGLKDEPTSIQQGNQTSLNHHLGHYHTKCPSPGKLLEQFNFPLDSLTVQDFLLLCPALLYKLDSGQCGQSRDDHPHHHHDHSHDHHDHSHDLEEPDQTYISASVPGKVWGYSTAAVTVISLAGLLGVAVVPIMQKVFYNHLLQFLVAVAVGALSGDALLHLLPHALAENLEHDHGSEENSHLKAVWKGLTALLCIFFFFLIERVLTIFTEKRRRKKTMSRLKKKRCEKLCDAENTGKVGAKLSAHEEGDYTDCEQMVMVVHPNRALKGYADATHEVLMHQCDESLSQGEHTFSEIGDNSTIPLGHSHSHGHGHGHSQCDTMPGSVAAVAWMLIFGDGIHNFSDGLAIGAAFASSVTGGISTSIAIFCHELPHEIGDFAVLLRAGMSVKQAIVYNCLSSILCFVGMLIGVAIGNIHNASIWIFSGVAGMFLYISMVDMLPEMTVVDTKKGENQFLHLFLQVIGMMLGAGIMFIIAVFEHDLKQMLD